MSGEISHLERTRAELAVLDACLPLQEELQAAKDAYRRALDDGVPQEIEEAKCRKAEAAVAINETRRWLRREHRIAELPGVISGLEQKIASTDKRDEELPDLRASLADRKAELARLQHEAAPYRAALAALGGTPGPSAPAARDGSASVYAPTVGSAAKVQEVG